MNPFVWILAVYPLYLLINGRLVHYVKLAGAQE